MSNHNYSVGSKSFRAALGAVVFLKLRNLLSGMTEVGIIY